MDAKYFEEWKKEFQKICIRCSTSILSNMKTATEQSARETKVVLNKIKALHQKHPDVLNNSILELGQLIYSLQSQVDDYNGLENKRGRKVWHYEMIECILFIMEKCKGDKDSQKLVHDYLNKDGEFVSWQKREFKKVIFEPPSKVFREDLITKRFNEIKRTFEEALFSFYFRMTVKKAKELGQYERLYKRLRVFVTASYPRDHTPKSIIQTERDELRDSSFDEI